MTRLLRLALALTLAAPGVALAQQGRVQYTVTTSLNIELPPEMAHLMDQMPSERSDTRELLFTESEALTRSLPSEEEPDDPTMMSDTGGGAQAISLRRVSSADNQTYIDLATGAMTEQRDLLGRTFRIVGAQPPYAWRLTGEQSEFLGYPCQRAVAMRDSTTIEAWFTTQIPASVGPGTYGGLPGLILVLTDGNRTFEATDVQLATLADGEIEVPTDGREVTREAFAEIMEERMRDLETTGLSTTSPSGGRSTFRVIQRSN